MKLALIVRRSLRIAARLGFPLLVAGAATQAVAINLADQPLFSTVQVPGNLIFTLSVEFPTASVSAYYSATTYSATTQYVGYFDPAKCYTYKAINSGTSSAPNYSGSYFVPYSVTTSTSSSTPAIAVCSSSSATPLWSGNYLNWAGMLSLDEFRWVLTGGSRIAALDTTSMTVLTRTYHSGQDGGGDAPNKKVTSSTDLAGATPFNWSSASTRIWGLGSAMAITGSGSLSGTLTTVPYTVQSSQSSPAASSSSIYLVYLNVQVCNATVGLESNCVLYSNGSGGNNYKPEGLMQKYSSQLRYSAFGYLNDSNVLRDGGVMRAALKFIGPTQPVPGSANIANSLAEWNSSTGIMAINPNPADATATTTASTAAGNTTSITQSGVMNYLNNFGYTAQSYKTHDPVSELYYAAIRYLKNQVPVPEYSSLTATGSPSAIPAWLDGFPVITSYPDPILYTCQKNFIIGIGDEHTWQDANLPGSALIPSSYEPTEPTTVVADTTVNVKTATNMIGQLEGTGSIGNNYYSGGSTKATYYIAGLAYDAHTNNLRPDLSTPSNPVNITASTYWLDVLEQPGYQSKNQYYYAAKYGGFTVPSGFSPYATTNGTSTLPLNSWYNSTTTIGGDKQPDNFFTANNALAMQASLNSAFSKIIAANQSQNSSSFSVPKSTANSGSISYAATYDPSSWTGQVLASTDTFAADGTPTLTQLWDARALLSATTTTASSRRIVTCCTTTAGAYGLPFTYAALTGNTLNSRTNYATFAAVPGAASQSTQNYIAYLRGDTSTEIANGGAYRTRTYRLGDIVNSKPLPVGPPSAGYYDTSNPGYSAFASTYASRKTVVYVGANDGMLHAFDGSASGGTELFAYIPSFVYGTAASAPTTGLASLGNPSFVHHYLVDAPPTQVDVDMKATYGSTATANDWRSLLVGGLGKGGMGYYALDVSDPSTFDTEAHVAAKVLWEFTDPHMGYSYGTPNIVKTKKYGWVVVMTSGFNNSDGMGYFFFVNPLTGALLEPPVSTPSGSGSAAAPLNISQATAFIPDYTDRTADAIYAGDMQGNVWRLDVTGTTGNYPTPVKIATLTDGSGNPQPVTTWPLIATVPSTNARYVLVGTGRLLADSDIASGAVQSLYSIADGTGNAGGFYTSSSLPTGVNYPITRDALNPDTNLLQGIGPSPTSAMGWYFDLPVVTTTTTPATTIAQRVNVEPTVNAGIVFFAANTPNGSTCSPTGTGSVYAINFATGKTVLQDSSGNFIASSPGNLIRDISILSVNGSLRLISGDSLGNAVVQPAQLSSAGAVKQLNWRDIPATN